MSSTNNWQGVLTKSRYSKAKLTPLVTLFSINPRNFPPTLD
jgi:hypothetical protein